MSSGVLAVAALLAVGAAVLAAERLGDARKRLVDRVDPARVSALALTRATLDQETGVRGYVLGGRPESLEPYRVGRRDGARALRELERYAAGEPRLRTDLSQVRSLIVDWRVNYAQPTIDRVRRAGPAGDDQGAAQGKARFDSLRRALDDLGRNLQASRREARSELDGAAATLRRALTFAAIVLLLGLGVLAVVGRGLIALPVGRLADQVRAVASGALGRRIEPSGPRDVARLGDDVESMRRRILAELEAVRAAQEEIEAKAADLERSNAELEQFAYVASHDLQEPLRKVTSFCQMIERRYGGQLDERGEQYIYFAVDGAKRMQVLISDLLAFSRVGRMGRDHEVVGAGDLVGQAIANLSTTIEETAAEVDVAADLPPVQGERSLLTLVFQNLIANVIKFRADEPPRVRVSAERDGDYHGGRIWLEERRNGRGATFHFTLPVVGGAAPAERPMIERTAP